MSYTGSVTENRVMVGIPPPVRQFLVDEARGMGIRTPELIRHLLMRYYEEKQIWREAKR